MQFLNNYLTSPFHQWWVNNVWKPSWTRFVTFVYGLPALALMGVQYIGQLAGDDQISQFLAKMNVPNWIPIGLAFIAMIHYIAHGRKSGDA